jgi:hypothetical protein
LFVVTPNKWNLLSVEPHVRLWGVQLLPRRIADRYVGWRVGVPYSSVASLLSYPEFRRTLEAAGTARATFIPIEDKHLNPRSRRGRALKKFLQSAPLSWLSRCLQPLQPTLGALCLKAESEIR